MNGYSQNERDPFVLYGAGISSAVTLFTVEICLFFWDVARNILPTFSAQSTTTNQVIGYYSEIIAIFAIVAIIQNAIVGFISPKAFVFGYLTGVGILTYFLYISAMNVIPSVIYAMTASFAICIGSFIIRLHLEKPKYNNPYQGW